MNENLKITAKVLSDIAPCVEPSALVAATVSKMVLVGVENYEERKQTKLIDQVLTRIAAIEKTGILELLPLVNNESFLSLLVTAARVARNTDRKEKLLRIGNVVVNCVNMRIEHESCDRFFHLIDQLVEEHFIIITLLNKKLKELNGIKKLVDVYNLLKNENLELNYDEFAHYFYDLKNRRLIRVSDCVTDNEGLYDQTNIITSLDISGDYVQITAIARELLEITEAKQK